MGEGEGGRKREEGGKEGVTINGGTEKEHGEGEREGWTKG